MTPLRNLLVIAVNHLVSNHMIELEIGNDGEEIQGHTFTTIAGKNAVINWQGINCDEIRVSVWWDYDHSNHPQANLEGSYRETFCLSKPLAKSQHYPKFIGAMVSGWIERKTGKYLQGIDSEGLYDKYTRRSSKLSLEKIPRADGIGFKTSGKFFL